MFSYFLLFWHYGSIYEYDWSILGSMFFGKKQWWHHHLFIKLMWTFPDCMCTVVEDLEKKGTGTASCSREWKGKFQVISPTPWCGGKVSLTAVWCSGDSNLTTAWCNGEWNFTTAGCSGELLWQRGVKSRGQSCKKSRMGDLHYPISMRIRY
jgi:hypothetical protein